LIDFARRGEIWRSKNTLMSEYNGSGSKEAN
jgi:hypothetical protein